MKIGLKNKIFSLQGFFYEFLFQKWVKNEFQDNKKNHAADSKIGSPQKVDFRADGTYKFHPTVWELKFTTLTSNGNTQIFWCESKY